MKSIITTLITLLALSCFSQNQKHVIEKHGNGNVYEDYYLIVTSTQQMRLSTTDVWDKTLGNFQVESGLIDGEYKRYYENGQLELLCFFDKNIHHGPFKTYYPTGELQKECVYDDGKLSGPLTWYNPDGSVFEATIPIEDGYQYEIHPSSTTVGKGILDKNKMFKSFEFTWVDNTGVSWVETYFDIDGKWSYDDYQLGIQRGNMYNYFMKGEFETKGSNGDFFKTGEGRSCTMKRGDYVLAQKTTHRERPPVPKNETIYEKTERLTADDDDEYGAVQVLTVHEGDNIVGDILVKDVFGIWGLKHAFTQRRWKVMQEVVNAIEDADAQLANNFDSSGLKKEINDLYSEEVKIGSLIQKVPVKKKLIKAALILWDDYEAKGDFKSITKLNDLLIELRDNDTKELEKNLKNEVDPRVIESLLF